MIATVAPGMALWRERLFVSMSRNAVKATDFFRIPTNRVVELGSRIEIGSQASKPDRETASRAGG